MRQMKKVAPIAITAALAVGVAGPTLPAFGSSTHWSSAQCKSWEKGFVKRNPHASKTRKAEGNHVLKAHGCTLRIK